MKYFFGKDFKQSNFLPTLPLFACLSTIGRSKWRLESHWVSFLYLFRFFLPPWKGFCLWSAVSRLSDRFILLLLLVHMMICWLTLFTHLIGVCVCVCVCVCVRFDQVFLDTSFMCVSLESSVRLLLLGQPKFCMRVQCFAEGRRCLSFERKVHWFIVIVFQSKTIEFSWYFNLLTVVFFLPGCFLQWFTNNRKCESTTSSSVQAIRPYFAVHLLRIWMLNLWSRVGWEVTGWRSNQVSAVEMIF